MTSKLTSDPDPTVKVAQAASAVRRAIGRLVQHLADEDERLVYAAGVVLGELGGRAVVGPLAAALSRSSSPRHRALIVGVLASFGLEERSSVLPALFAAKKRERDILVAAIIENALMKLMLADPNPGRSPTRSTLADED